MVKADWQGFTVDWCWSDWEFYFDLVPDLTFVSTTSNSWRGNLGAAGKPFILEVSFDEHDRPEEIAVTGRFAGVDFVGVSLDQPWSDFIAQLRSLGVDLRAIPENDYVFSMQHRVGFWQYEGMVEQILWYSPVKFTDAEFLDFIEP